jgi:hypothetical protein
VRAGYRCRVGRPVLVHSLLHVGGGSMAGPSTGNGAEEEMAPLPHRLLSRGRELWLGVPEIGHEEAEMVGVLPNRLITASLGER